MHPVRVRCDRWSMHVRRRNGIVSGSQHATAAQGTARVRTSSMPCICSSHTHHSIATTNGRLNWECIVLTNACMPSLVCMAGTSSEAEDLYEYYDLRLYLLPCCFQLQTGRVWLRRTLEIDPRERKAYCTYTESPRILNRVYTTAIPSLNCIHLIDMRFVGKRPTASGGGHGQGWP
jgi:hypothetical protein